MMLWYKAWRESRVRFLFLVLFVIAFCAYFILLWRADQRANLARGHPTLVTMGYGAVFPVQRLAIAYLVVFVPLLSMGGLLRERGRGTAELSLSVPVSRLRQLGVRAVVGMLEVAALAAMPAVLVPAFMPFVKEAHPISVGLHFVLLWVVCGALIFAVGVLCSTIVAGEYTSLIASIIVVLSYVYFTSPPFFRSYSPRFSLFRVMMGMNIEDIPYDWKMRGLPEPFPWMTLVIIGTVALVLFAVSVQVNARRDF